MEIPIPSRYPPPGRDFGTLPSISHGDGFHGYFGFSRNNSIDTGLSPSVASHPMAIHSSDSHMRDVPPPLPPPRLAPVDGPIDPSLEHFKENPMYREFDGPSSDPFGHMSHRRRDTVFRTEIDEGYQSIDTARSPIDPRPSSSFGLQSMKSFRPNGNAIDRSMVNKLDGRRRPDDRSSRNPSLSSSAGDVPTSRALHTQLTTLSLPDRTKFLGTSSSYANSPIALSAASPLAGPFSHGMANHGDFRSSLGAEVNDTERSPLSRARRTNSGSVPDDATLSTISREDDTEFPIDETQRMRRLVIDGDEWRDRERQEYYQTVGLKRRASSPPGDELPLGSDVVRRREGTMYRRGSPTPRLQVPQPAPSLSSGSSGRSYVSQLTASSMTSMLSMNSFGRRSPNGLSPSGLSPTETVPSPFATPVSLTTSPRSSINRALAAQAPHSRTLSEHNRALASPRKYAEIPKNASSGVASKMKDPYMCQCCPKKPKKFDTEEELNAHSAEKQYECSFCGSRFKNKNEAERHQNSLHVRRHSWSCSALTGYERAFHDSPSRPGEADTCGYCGEEFNRTGAPGGPGQTGRYCSDQDWEERIRHLQDVHKFRECNSSKKFYRADHFRQHLKHSHAGTSGKWTNMLENACMIEEESPVPR